MKKTLIMVALAAAGIVAYLLNRKKPAKTTVPVERKHHITKVFSKAKQHAVHQ